MMRGTVFCVGALNFMETKKCAKCFLIKPLDDFYKAPNRNFYNGSCRVCCASNKRIRDSKNNKRPFVDIDGEIWVGIEDAPDKYEVSNKCRLRSLYKEVNGIKWYYHTPKILECGLNNHGYKFTVLRINGIDTGRLLHRMFANKFLPNPLNLPFINHKDADKTNNDITNLEWCTQKENVRHAFSMGIVNTAFGENAGKSKLKENEVFDIFNSKEQKSILAKRYKVNFSSIHAIKTGKNWKHLKLI